MSEHVAPKPPLLASAKPLVSIPEAVDILGRKMRENYPTMEWPDPPDAWREGYERGTYATFKRALHSQLLGTAEEEDTEEEDTEEAGTVSQFTQEAGPITPADKKGTANQFALGPCPVSPMDYAVHLTMNTLLWLLQHRDVRAVAMWAEKGGPLGLPVLRHDEIAPGAWLELSRGLDCGERLEELCLNSRLMVESGEAVVFVSRAEAEGVTGERVIEAVEAVEKTRKPENTVVLEAAYAVKAEGNGPTSGEVQAYMKRAGLLRVHPARNGLESWLEVYDVHGKNLGPIDRSYFRALVKRARDN